MKRLQGLIQGKCPRCHQGDVFEKPLSLIGLKLPEMNKACSHCGHIFEKESGFFWGSMFVSYAFTVAEAVLVFLAGQLFFTETFADGIIWMIAIAILLLARFNFRYARLAWIYIFTSETYDV